ncbi:MAG: hypothetical protein ABIR46_01760 [Candidatus Saccharimonadales bacterium]
MKKNEIAILVLIIGLTALIGYFVGKSLLGGSQLKPVQVESARALTSDVTKPDSTVFNAQGINPTMTITISPNNQNILGN